MEFSSPQYRLWAEAIDAISTIVGKYLLLEACSRSRLLQHHVAIESQQLHMQLCQLCTMLHQHAKDTQVVVIIHLHPLEQQD